MPLELSSGPNRPPSVNGAARKPTHSEKDYVPSRRADTISTAEGAELLARDGSDARTSASCGDVVARLLGVSLKVDAEKSDIGSVKTLTGIP